MSKVEQYKSAIRANMKSAEKDLSKPEDRRGFVIGAVLKLWEVYHDKQLDERQFDTLIAILASFSKGEYRDFISEQVASYKAGNPPTIIGY